MPCAGDVLMSTMALDWMLLSLCITQNIIAVNQKCVLNPPILPRGAGISRTSEISGVKGCEDSSPRLDKVVSTLE